MYSTVDPQHGKVRLACTEYSLHSKGRVAIAGPHNCTLRVLDQLTFYTATSTSLSLIPVLQHSAFSKILATQIYSETVHFQIAMFIVSLHSRVASHTQKNLLFWTMGSLFIFDHFLTPISNNSFPPVERLDSNLLFNPVVTLGPVQCFCRASS